MKCVCDANTTSQISLLNYAFFRNMYVLYSGSKQTWMHYELMLRVNFCLLHRLLLSSVCWRSCLLWIFSSLSFEEEGTWCTIKHHKTSTWLRRSECFKRAGEILFSVIMSPLKCWLSKQASLSLATENKCEKLCLSSELGVNPNKEPIWFQRATFGEAVSKHNQLAGCSGEKAPAGFVLNVLWRLGL